MLNALRLIDGFEPELLQARTGLKLHTVADRLERAVADGLLVADGQRIRASEFGLRFLNDLVARFLVSDGGSEPVQEAQCPDL